MAYLVDEPIPLAPILVAQATYPVSLAPLSLSLVNDDWLVLCILYGNTSGTLSIAGTGWTELSELDVTSGQRMSIYACKVTAGTAADPTVSISTGTGLWMAAISQWRDADATNLMDSIITSEGNAVSVVTGTMTPATNNCTILYFSTGRSTAVTGSNRYLSNNVVGRLTNSADDGSTYMDYSLGTVQQTTAAATAQTMYSNLSHRLGTIVLAIKNKTNGGYEADSRAGITKMAWMGNYGASHEGLSTTWGKPSEFCSSLPTINGVNTDNSIPTVSNTGDIGSNVASIVNTTGAWCGGWFPLSTTIDATNKLISLEWFVTTITSPLGSQGVCIAFGDDAAANTGNAVIYSLLERVNIVANQSRTSFIDPTTAIALQSVGTMNWATVNKIGIFFHRYNSSALSRSVTFKNLLVHSNTVLTGGNSGRPLDVRFLNAALNGWSYTGICSKQGNAVMVNTPIQFGDGTTLTYVDTTATMLNTPKSYNSITQNLWNAQANALTIGIKAAANDTIKYSAASTVSGCEQNFTIDASSDIGATYTFIGQTFSGILPTWKTGIACNGAVFSQCNTVAFKGANVTGCTLTASTNTNAVCSWDTSSANCSSTSIDATGTNYHIELGASVTTITLTDVTFIGTPGINRVHVLKTTGTVTITISGTTSLSAGQVTSAGATVVISAPLLYQSVTISGAVSGSRIQIYDTTHSAELYNGTPTFPYTWTDSVAAASSRAIRLRVAKQSTVTAKAFIEANIGTCGTTSGTEIVNYLVNQVDDPVYNTNAIDGSTVTGITIAPSPARVSINIAGGAVTWPQIYAYQVYWLFTATGIADEAAFITAPDTANYLLANFDIKNTNANPLTITGGYGRDATTGLVKDIIDTAGSTGNIFPSPDHAIPYSSGSGLTAGQDAQLMGLPSASTTAASVLSAATTTPIAANIKQVNSITVTGAGTAGNPWGP